MFFNCCKRCCCRQGGIQEKDCRNKYDYDKCDKYNDNHKKCDCRDDKYDKCDFEKKEKCCYHINCENRYSSNGNNEKFDNCSSQNNRYGEQDGRYNSQSYYGEYNNLGYFNQQDRGYQKYDDRNNVDNRKSYQKEDCYDKNFEKNCYTPNWDDDRDCKCEKDKNDKCDKKEHSNCCKPVKYICIPFNKY